MEEFVGLKKFCPMSRSDVAQNLRRINDLLEEFEVRIPAATPRNAAFRADLAGLLVVLIAATYENCVKDIFERYADSKHKSFSEYVGRKYDRLNSRINTRDLFEHAKNFDPDICEKFRDMLSRRKKAIAQRAGVDITESYEQILRWRHAFAHEGLRNVTLEEAAKFCRYANRVIIIYDAAFGC